MRAASRERHRRLARLGRASNAGGRARFMGRRTRFLRACDALQSTRTLTVSRRVMRAVHSPPCTRLLDSAARELPAHVSGAVITATLGRIYVTLQTAKSLRNVCKHETANVPSTEFSNWARSPRVLWDCAVDVFTGVRPPQAQTQLTRIQIFTRSTQELRGRLGYARNRFRKDGHQCSAAKVVYEVFRTD
ncbi:hypothetical protein HPB51_013702 [Rhipicephalus microplus]|uniref:Uncharacterized protein n=1 Tax=Rhipicephalus microplus TaxID=6941 RepID=A0A9J6F2M2_RHIMP|nr:hypothetical protein HPB51_013702 [Rhipicephalus microplus]